MDLEPLIMLVPVLAALTLGWFSAEKAYRFHKNLKRTDPFLFKIGGMNERYLDDKSLWIKHFRVYVVLICLVCLCIVLTMVLA
jgi:hypothetical protein